MIGFCRIAKVTERSDQALRAMQDENEFGHISSDVQQLQSPAEVQLLDFGFDVPEVLQDLTPNSPKGSRFNPHRSMDHKRYSRRQTMRWLTRNKIV